MSVEDQQMDPAVEDQKMGPAVEDQKMDPALHAQVRLEVGDCHLVDDPQSWVRDESGSILFSDDDLRVRGVTCHCAQRYLDVGRRVPQDWWQFLIPVTSREIDDFEAVLAAAPQNYSDHWHAAEREVQRLTATRPYVEHCDSSPVVLRWSTPGQPLAFKFAPF